MEKYTACPDCSNARARNNYTKARNCQTCHGYGMVIDREVACNQCGGKMAAEGDPNVYGLVRASVQGGYGSTHLFDMTTYCFSLCEACLRTMFQGFTVPPGVSSFDDTPEDYSTFEKDDLAHRTWVKSGGRVAKLATGVCNATEACKNEAAFRYFVSGNMTDESFCVEHARGGAGNTAWVPEERVRGIPKSRKEQTVEQARRLADALLVAMSPTGHAWHYVVEPPVVDALYDGIFPGRASMLWIADTSPMASQIEAILASGREYCSLKLASGTVICGERGRLQSDFYHHAREVGVSLEDHEPPSSE